jgi:YVTN family beta-propeller protein
MKKMNFYNLLKCLPFAALGLLYSCGKDSTSTSGGTYSKGVIVVNQGNYSSGNGSISFYNRDSNKMYNDVFYNVNQRVLGDVAQSIGETSDKYYIVVNNSNKVEVVNKSDFKSVGVIEGFYYPRYFLAINDTLAYVSQWGNGSVGQVEVVNLKTYTIVKSISTANGAEALLKHGNYVYVANSGGNSNTDTVTVINSLTHEVSANIVVGQNPVSLVEDKNSKIWVLCGGKWKTDGTYGLEIPGALVRINPNDNTVEQTINFSSLAAWPVSSPLTISKEKDLLTFLYNGSVYSLGVDGTSTDPTLRISRSFYSIGVDPRTGYLYGADVGNYSSDGWVIRYDTNFAKKDSFEVGVIPGYFFFN